MHNIHCNAEFFNELRIIYFNLSKNLFVSSKVCPLLVAVLYCTVLYCMFIHCISVYKIIPIHF